MDGKVWYKSRSLWIAFFTIIAGLTSVILDNAGFQLGSTSAQVITIIGACASWMIRWATDTPILVRKRNEDSNHSVGI